MTWEPELDELHRREELARQMGGPERVARQRAAGKLTVRERVERLRDTRPILCDWAARAHEIIALDARHGPMARGTRP